MCCGEKGAYDRRVLPEVFRSVHYPSKLRFREKYQGFWQKKGFELQVHIHQSGLCENEDDRQTAFEQKSIAQCIYDPLLLFERQVCVSLLTDYFASD